LLEQRRNSMPWLGQWIEAVLHTDRDLLIGDVTLGRSLQRGGANRASSPPQTASPKKPQHGQDHDHDDDDFEHGAQSTPSRTPAVEQVRRRVPAAVIEDGFSSGDPSAPGDRRADRGGRAQGARLFWRGPNWTRPIRVAEVVTTRNTRYGRCPAAGSKPRARWLLV
jgi:hypothetical protein